MPEELWEPRPGIDAALDESVLRITATGVSPEAVAQWANEVSEELIVERSAAGGPIELILLDPAVEPLVPTAPNARPILLASMAVAVIAAVFAALAADRIAQAFDTRHAVRERLGTTILGEIPKFTRSARKLPVVSLLADGEKQSNQVITAFETIRINVEFRLLDRPARAISVISLDRHAGKTTVAAGLSCRWRSSVATSWRSRPICVARRLQSSSAPDADTVSAISLLLVPPRSFCSRRVTPR